MKKLLFGIMAISSVLAANEYDRSSYGGWIDADSDCQDTRVEELIAHAESYSLSENGCLVVSGRWFDPYTETYFTDPSKLDIDHIVPLEWAHQHGAEKWPDARKKEFANDPENLIPVSASANRSKGSKGFLKWLPNVNSRTSQCAYILHFSYIMSKYDLAHNGQEKVMAERVIGNCR